MTTLSSSALPNNISSIQTDINELNNKILVLENKILGMENEFPGIDKGIGDYEERVRSSYSMKMNLLLKYQDKQNLLIGRLSQGMYVYMNSKLVRKIIIYIHCNIL